MTKINRVYFLIHPVCWAHSLVDGKAPPHSRETEYMAIYDTEMRVRKLQDERIANMKEDELLVLYPIGHSDEMEKLETYALHMLGERCIILRRQPIVSTTADGYLPDDVLLALSKEILTFCIHNGYDWNAQGIKVLYTNKGYALDLHHEIVSRNILIDPCTVESEAFGEGFEQCAMTWKGMVGRYLGWVNPTENNYELSVSGAPFLINATFKERISLQQDIRLFLWEGSHGRPLGLYAKASFRLTDPRFFVNIHKMPDGMELLSITGELLWPLPRVRHNPVQLDAKSVVLPVYEGSRRFFDDEAVYIRGRNVSVEQFKDMLLQMEITQQGS